MGSIYFTTYQYILNYELFRLPIFRIEYKLRKGGGVVKMFENRIFN